MLLMTGVILQIILKNIILVLEHGKEKEMLKDLLQEDIMGDVVKYNPLQPEYDAPGRGLVEDDFEAARKNLLEIIESGKESIAQLALLADQSQNDKYYAALSSLMKTVVDANEKHLKLQEDIRRITKKEDSKVIN